MNATWNRENASNPKPRTLEQVRESLTRIKAETKDGADLTMARMMVNHGNLTSEAREFAANWK